MMEGTAWIRVMERHDQSLLMDAVPQPTTETTSLVSEERRDNVRLRTQRTQVPETVVDGGQRATVLGVADLSEKHGRAHLGHRVAETKDEATGDVHCKGQRVQMHV